MTQTRRFLSSFLLIISLLMILTSAVYADMDTATLQLLDQQIGERTYNEWSEINLSSDSTYSEVIDWLESYADNEIGYRQTLITHSLIWMDLIEEKAQNTYSTQIPEWNATIMDEWKKLDEPETKIDFYLDRISYNSERMDFLIDELKLLELDEEVRAGYQTELTELSEKTSQLKTDLLSSKNELTSAVNNSLDTFSVEGESFNRIWDAAEPLIAAENERLTEIENAKLGGSSNVNINIQVIDKTEFAILATENGKALADVEINAWIWAKDQFDRPDKYIKRITNNKGVAVFRIADFKPDSDEKVTITYSATKQGYRLHEYEKLTIKGGKFSKIGMVKDNGDPYFSMMSWNGRDMLSEDNAVFRSSKNFTDQVVNLRYRDPNGKERSVTMYQDDHKYGEKKAKPGDVITFKGKYLNQMKAGSKITFYTGWTSWWYKYESRMMVKKAYTDEPSVTERGLGLIKNMLKIAMPVTFPIMEDSKFDLGFMGGQVKVAVDLSGTLTVSVSPKKLEHKMKSYDWSTADQQALDDYEKEFDAKTLSQTANMKLGIFDQTVSNQDRNLLGKSKGSVKFIAEAQLKYESKTDRFSGKISAGVAIGYKFELTKTVFVWGVPVYFGFDFSAGAGLTFFTGASCNGNFADWAWMGLNVTFNVKLELGVCAGVGIKGIASIGVRGFGYLKFDVVCVGDGESLFTAAAGINLELVFLFWSKTVELWATPKHTQPIEVQKSVMLDEYADVNDESWSGWEGVPLTVANTQVIDLPLSSASGDPSFGLKPDEEKEQIKEMGMIGNTLKIISISAPTGKTDPHFPQHYQNTLAFYIKNEKLPDGNIRPRLVMEPLFAETKLNEKVVFDFAAGCSQNSPNCNMNGYDPARYDYTFDVDAKSWDTDAWVIITLIGGTRQGISDQNTEEDLLKAGEQSNVYSIVLKLINDGKYSFELKEKNAHFLYGSHDGRRVSLPRARVLGYHAYSSCDFVTSFYVETGLRGDGLKTYSIQQRLVRENGLWNDTSYMYFSDKDPVIDYQLSDSTVWIRDEYVNALGVILTRNKDNPDKNTVYVTASDAGDRQKTVKTLYKAQGTYSAISRLDVRDLNRGCLYTRGFAFLNGKLTGGKNGEAKTFLTLATLSGNKVNSEAENMNGLSLQVKDTNLNTGTDQFNTVSLINDDLKPATAVYLYWAQSIEEKNAMDQLTHKNVIRASLLDLSNGMATPAFTLLETDNLPINIYLDRLKSYYKHDLDASYGFYTHELPNLKNNFSLYRLKYKSAAVFSLLGANSEQPVVAIGDTIHFLSSIRNDGNLVIDKARLKIERKDKKANVVYMDIDFKEPVKSQITYQTREGEEIYTSDAFSIYEIPSMYDSIFTDTLVSQIANYQVNGDQVVMTGGEYDSQNLAGILPGEVGTFKGQIEHVPADWHGEAELVVSVASTTSSMTPQTKSNAIAAANNISKSDGNTVPDGALKFSDYAYIEYKMDIADDGSTKCTAIKTKKDGNSVEESCDNYAAYRYVSDPNTKRERMDRVDLFTAPNDLDINVRTFEDNGETWVDIAIDNQSGYRDNNAAPIINVVLDDDDDDTTAEVPSFTYAFAQPITERHAYSMTMPLANLTKGGLYEEIKLSVNGGSNYEDWNVFNDADIIEARPEVDIIRDPQDVTVNPGSDAVFSIQAQVPAEYSFNENDEAVVAKSAAYPLRYQWQYRDLNNNWFDVPGATQETLTLKNVDVSMNGYVYWCVVYDINGAGRMSGTAVLNVSGTPAPKPFFPIFFKTLPATGFSSHMVGNLAQMPASINYKAVQMNLEIPSIYTAAEIVEVPVADDNYAVEWLGAKVGLLEGSALPGEGTSFITGHNHLNTTEAGPFAFLSDLKEGDRIFVRDRNNELLSFQVYSSQLIDADDIDTLKQTAALHENSLNLLTCENEDPNGGYTHRRLVSAIPTK